MRKIIPLLLALLALAAGSAAGVFLRPPESAEAPDAEAEAPDAGDAGAEAPRDYLKLNNQFIVPVVEDGRVAALVVLALGLEIEAGQSETVFAREPKLQDAFLQVLFDHANAGGFRGSFTDAGNLVFLRKALLEQAIAVLGPVVSDVLITEIARQDG